MSRSRNPDYFTQIKDPELGKMLSLLNATGYSYREDVRGELSCQGGTYKAP
jgi:hypothetical protein